MIKKSARNVMASDTKYDDRIAQLERQVSSLSEKGSPTPSRFSFPQIQGKWLGVLAVPLIVGIFLGMSKPQMIMKNTDKGPSIVWSSLFKWDMIITAILLISAYLYVYYDKRERGE